MSDSDLRKAAQDISAYFAGNPYGLVSAHLMERLRAALAQPERQAATCEWTNCPTRVGDRCCNEAAQPEQQAEPVECARCGHMNWIMPGKNAS